MKDLVITDINAAPLATFRVEMLSNSPANIEILEIKNPSGVKVDFIQLANVFYNRLNYSWQAFLTFCATNNLKITASDSNGSNSIVLLANQVPVGTQHPIVSATASTKTFLVGSDIHTGYLSGQAINVYNPDNTLFGSFTLASDSTYSSPNTTIVVNETVPANIPTSSGKFLI